MAEDLGERTEQPTARRRRDARNEGRVAVSRDLSQAGRMLASAVILLSLGAAVVNTLATILKRSLGQIQTGSGIDGGRWGAVEFAASSRSLIAQLGADLLPVLCMLACTVVALHLLQTRALFRLDAVRPRLDRLSPAQGIERVFSWKQLAMTASSVVKLTVLLIVAGIFAGSRLQPALGILYRSQVSSDGLGATEIGQFLGDTIVEFMFVLAGTMLGIGAIDYLVRRWRFEAGLRMTPEEIRQELKESNVSPMTSQRRQQLRAELARMPAAPAWEQTDLVIYSPADGALALRFDPFTMTVPEIAWRQIDAPTDQLIAAAERHGVLCIDDSELARQLAESAPQPGTLSHDILEPLVSRLSVAARRDHRIEGLLRKWAGADMSR